MIKQGNVSLRLDMLFDQLGKISSINHVIWCDYHIWMMHFFDAFHIFVIGSNIGVVDIVSLVAVSEKNLQPSALGVNVIMTSGADMGNQSSWFLFHVDLNAVNAAVAQVGNREVDHTVSAQE